MLMKSKLRERLQRRLFGRRMPEIPANGGGSSLSVLAEAAWYARAVALGASPPAATRAAVLAFFTSFYAAGFLTADFDYIYLLIGEAAGDTSTNKYNQKRVNLIAPGTFDATVVNPNASGHGAAGTVGNNSMYWTNNYKSSTMSVDRKDNASFGVVPTAVPTPGSAFTTMGIGAGSHLVRAGYSSQRQVSYGTVFVATAGTYPSLLYVMTNATDVFMYSSATLVTTNTTDPTTIPDISASLFSLYNGASAFQQTDETLAFAWHGRGFSAGERTSWYTMVQTLMAAFGVTI